MRPLHTLLATASVLALAAATAARADVTISSDVTQNISCANGVCQPTASDAVLNVGDLETLLASGNVTVTTTGSGVQAGNIDVTSDLGWSANALTLDAYQSISVSAPVTVGGKNGLTILTNDGGSGGELAFFGKGHVTFKKLAGKLAINGTRYKLVDSIASLAAGIQNNPAGDYALASNYNAGKDGTYGSAPITSEFAGSFEGLGNTISNLTINSTSKNVALGFFSTVDEGSGISDFGLVNVNITSNEKYGFWAGAMVGLNDGVLFRSYATGSLSHGGTSTLGGLVGFNNSGTIMECNASVAIIAGRDINSRAGGLVGDSGGTIVESYASGNVDGGPGSSAGGLAGIAGDVSNSYATGNVTGGAAGGLIGENDGNVGSSYSTGAPDGYSGSTGGLIGTDQSQSGSLSDTYWDTKTSRIKNLGQGAGYPVNDPGITGLSSKQLQSGLPAGFDPTVWGESADINNGLPYLLANPPK